MLHLRMLKTDGRNKEGYTHSCLLYPEIHTPKYPMLLSVSVLEMGQELSLTIPLVMERREKLRIVSLLEMISLRLEELLRRYSKH